MEWNAVVIWEAAHLLPVLGSSIRVIVLRTPLSHFLKRRPTRTVVDLGSDPAFLGAELSMNDKKDEMPIKSGRVGENTFVV